MKSTDAIKIGELGKAIKECEGILQSIYNNKSFSGELHISDNNNFNITKVAVNFRSDLRIKILEFTEDILKEDLKSKKTELNVLMNIKIES